VRTTSSGWNRSVCERRFAAFTFPNREAVNNALWGLQAWVVANGLTLHPSKTRIVDSHTESFDFLGYRFEGKGRYPRPKSEAKFRTQVRSKTQRIDGRSLAVIIADLNRMLMGWFGYFRRCNR
jgi:RNA-directed DNA polymerase